MTTDPEKRRRRKQAVAGRAMTVDPISRHCSVIGCRNLSRAGAGKGLNRRYCKTHEEHHQRHGSPFRGTYGADWLNPYRRAAFDWLTANSNNLWVKNAIAGVQGLYRAAGQTVEAFRLRGLKPEERARAAWARLRKAEIDPRLPLAAWIAIEMITRDDPQAVTTNEYKRVQAAKIIHRIVSGTHKRWEAPRSDGGVLVTELHTFPVSRGRVLRHVGQQIERVAQLVVDKHLSDIATFKTEREKAGKLAKRAHPEGLKGLPKRTRKPRAKPLPTAGRPSPSPAAKPAAKQREPRVETLPDGTVITRY
jgi:hypothetical protein